MMSLMREIMKFLVWMRLCDANLLKVKLKICTEISFFYQENKSFYLNCMYRKSDAQL